MDKDRQTEQDSMERIRTETEGKEGRKERQKDSTNEQTS